MALVAGAGSGFTAGGLRAVMEASAHALQHGRSAALALVVETLGSSYLQSGAAMLFQADGTQVGWIRGDGLESALARHAMTAIEQTRLAWLELNSRHDEACFGTASGCRGRLRIVVLPLTRLPQWSSLVHAWLSGEGDLHLHLTAGGELALNLDHQRLQGRLESGPIPWSPSRDTAWRVSLPRPPRVLVHGAGPECGLLLPLLSALGMQTTLADRRLAPHLPPALPDENAPAFDAALVMHHHFALDLETLLAWSRVPESRLPGYIGLLGPVQRSADLLRQLPPSAQQTLTPRLRAPAGLPLGGNGPEAIALSIAAQLQHHLQSR